ncbi:DUF1365 domain-containing protein [Poseidonocella sedimentorum]|uniref:Cyclopropane-fatty-acyl-phospholipid synthase n=1 Tax=Poseidonocella sedimentorum TaxID=871652 RepID=A0A1I6E8P5_9RHOB|nr:DUF1365 domain-containing protein [Poseidonocella sedimentorum]SFR14076.1 hypothetical protein SAMN04515673_10877 [Poseidonocella sedimentorum]
MSPVEHIAGHTSHSRRGAIRNAFRYSIDYVLLDAETPPKGPWLFGRNRRNLASLWDSDHGGPVGQGVGAAWARGVLADHGVEAPGRLMLLAQPRMLGHVFNPVSFWLAHDRAGALRAVIAEVTNTFGERHSYLCQRPDGGPIDAEDRIVATKVFYVSPFQPIEGIYEFRFDIRDDRIGIWIDHRNEEAGVVATLSGPRAPLTSAGLLGAMLRRPVGARRVVALIFWQALKLRWKGARYRTRPEPPAEEVS